MPTKKITVELRYLGSRKPRRIWVDANEMLTACARIASRGKVSAIYVGWLSGEEYVSWRWSYAAAVPS